MGVPVDAPEDAIEPEAVATALAKVALDRKAFDVAILDMKTQVDYTDLFVLCTARNRRHVGAVAEELRLHAKRELDVPAIGVEGLTSSRWVLLDFGTVVVHVFEEPLRGFYNLDGLWSDAPRLPLPAAEDGATGDDDDDDDLDPITSEIELSG